MSRESSTYNVIHWEQNPALLDQPVELLIKMGVSGGWSESTPVLHFKWRIMGYANRVSAIHFLAEDNYPIANLSTFDESTMKEFVIKSQIQTQNELGLRLGGLGEVFLTDTTELLSNESIKRYHSDFMAIMKK